MFNTNKTLKALAAELAARGVTIERLQELQCLKDKGWLDECAAAMLMQLGKKPESKPTTPVETNHARARAIMGTNFLGIEEVEEKYGVKYTANQRQKLSMIPIDEATLRACSNDTHVLVAGFAMTINDIHRKVAGNASKLFMSAVGEGVCYAEPFANKAKVGVRWFLLRKKPIDQSTSKTYDDQLQLIPQGEKNPFARDVVFATILMYLVTGERLFENGYVRCKDVDTLGRRACVGYFNQDGLAINQGWAGYPGNDISICSIHKSK